MDLVMKIFLTYAAVSMTSALCILFLGGTRLISINSLAWDLFPVLWMGPLMLALAVGLPIGIWTLWSKAVILASNLTASRGKRWHERNE